MDGLIKGIEVDLSLIHFLVAEYFLEGGHHIADHLALPGLPTDVHQEDEHLFGWELRVNSTLMIAYPVAPSTRYEGDVLSIQFSSGE